MDRSKILMRQLNINTLLSLGAMFLMSLLIFYKIDFLQEIFQNIFWALVGLTIVQILGTIIISHYYKLFNVKISILHNLIFFMSLFMYLSTTTSIQASIILRGMFIVLFVILTILVGIYGEDIDKEVFNLDNQEEE